MKCIKCDREVIAKGLCSSHYVQRWRWNNGINRRRKVCANIGCNNNTQKWDLCGKCISEILIWEKHEEYNPHFGFRGELNPGYKGGVSEYPNHYIFKLNRLKRIEQEKGKCEICGKPYKYIHHKDLTKTNHNLDNLQVLCFDCHWDIHYPLRHNHKTHTYMLARSRKVLKQKKYYCIICGEFIHFRPHHTRSKFCIKCGNMPFSKRQILLDRKNRVNSLEKIVSTPQEPVLSSIG